jgi:hypothetical protein
MPNITTLATISTSTTATTFVVIDNALTRRYSYDNLKNKLTADITNSTGTGVPTIESPTNINLTARNAVVVTSSTFRVASFTSTQIGNLSGVNGDIVYNSTTNKFQGFANGSWSNLN